MVEYMPRSEAIVQAMPAIEAGQLIAPEAPGLGIDLDEDAVRRFRLT